MISRSNIVILVEECGEFVEDGMFLCFTIDCATSEDEHGGITLVMARAVVVTNPSAKD